jgi:hypothetical protein
MSSADFSGIKKLKRSPTSRAGELTNYLELLEGEVSATTSRCSSLGVTTKSSDGSGADEAILSMESPPCEWDLESLKLELAGKDSELLSVQEEIEWSTIHLAEMKTLTEDALQFLKQQCYARKSMELDELQLRVQRSGGLRQITADLRVQDRKNDLDVSQIQQKGVKSVTRADLRVLRKYKEVQKVEHGLMKRVDVSMLYIIYYLSYVTCRMSHAICHMLYATCYMSHAIYYM